MGDRIHKLSRFFLKFPGIGERQAKRFAFFLLAQHPEYIDQLTAAMRDARSAARECAKCYKLHEGTNDLCEICGNSERDQSKILVVEKQADLEAVERTSYQGLFFILGGLIPIVEKKTMAQTRTSLLFERIRADAEQGVLQEVILAFPLTSNGDHTDSYLRQELKERVAPTITVTSLGRGLSMGSELEYIDPKTLEISITKRE